MPLMKNLLLITAALSFACSAAAQGPLPMVHNNLRSDENGKLMIKDSAHTFYLVEEEPAYTLQQLKGNPRGDSRGIALYFGDLKGQVYYGFIDYKGSKHPQPVYYKEPVKIENGSALINIKEKLKGKYDMIGWEKTGLGTVGYRVVAENGTLLYDGIVSFSGKGPFKVIPSITEGPFVNHLGADGVTISFETSEAASVTVTINGKTFKDPGSKNNRHEVEIKGLKPDSTYTYTVKCGLIEQTYSLTTAPKPGSRNYFVFSYASDSRQGSGGGERNLYGVNAYMMKKIMALNSHKQVAFSQFTGDLVNGYLNHKDEMNLQYANWKRAVEPFAHYYPVYVGMGNHEALVNEFKEAGENGREVSIDKFPYRNESAEAVFAANFTNPEPGPESEDGASYDPDPKTTDFPPYDETVFYYTYDNVAMVVLNSNYWYSPSTEMVSLSSGNVHGYIMDKQLEWFEKTLEKLEKDSTIDHVFVTVHTPLFPNGGHVGDDMWYNGNNNVRPYIQGQPVAIGIIQRRDQLLHAMVNKSTKVLAVLTGDEHNYCKTEIGPKTPMYPAGWQMNRQQLGRTIYQVNNGAAGAPYYAQEQTPWSSFTTGFTTQYAVVYFHIEGKSVEVEVINPDTLEEIESFTLR